MSPRSHAEIEIAAAPESVFAWLVERARHAEWQRTSADWLPEDPAQLHAGYVGTEVVASPGVMAGPAFAREVTVHDHEPPRRFASTSRGEDLEVASGYELEPTAAGTLVRAWSETTLGAALRGIPLHGGAAGADQNVFAQRAHEDALARLKELAERG